MLQVLTLVIYDHTLLRKTVQDKTKWISFQKLSGPEHFVKLT